MESNPRPSRFALLLLLLGAGGLGLLCRSLVPTRTGLAAWSTYMRQGPNVCVCVFVSRDLCTRASCPSDLGWAGEGASPCASHGASWRALPSSRPAQRPAGRPVREEPPGPGSHSVPKSADLRRAGRGGTGPGDDACTSRSHGGSTQPSASRPADQSARSTRRVVSSRRICLSLAVSRRLLAAVLALVVVVSVGLPPAVVCHSRCLIY